MGVPVPGRLCTYDVYTMYGMYTINKSADFFYDSSPFSFAATGPSHLALASRMDSSFIHAIPPRDRADHQPPQDAATSQLQYSTARATIAARTNIQHLLFHRHIF